jgi:hypothetical protein
MSQLRDLFQALARTGIQVLENVEQIVFFSGVKRAESFASNRAAPSLA